MTDHAPGPRPLPADLDVDWTDTSALNPEDTILADAQALIDADHATWTDPDGVNSTHQPEQPE